MFVEPNLPRRPKVDEHPIRGVRCELCEGGKPFIWEWWDRKNQEIVLAHSECWTRREDR